MSVKFSIVPERTHKGLTGVQVRRDDLCYREAVQDGLASVIPDTARRIQKYRALALLAELEEVTVGRVPIDFRPNMRSNSVIISTG